MKAEPKEQPGHFHLEHLGVSKQVVMAAEARDRLDSGRRLKLRPYSSCMRWLLADRRSYWSLIGWSGCEW